MRSLFIDRVAELMFKGISSPSEIYDVVQPEFTKKGSVVTYSNVVSAIACVNNGWYVSDDEGKPDADPSK